MYKINVIKMPLKNGEIAEFGQTVSKDQLMNIEDLIERDYIKELKETKSEKEKETKSEK